MSSTTASQEERLDMLLESLDHGPLVVCETWYEADLQRCT